jgi:dTDP-glucose pyrophosphorylase
MTESETTTIILCGGPINYTNLPIGTNLSNAMIPVNGKPVIGWILDDLLAKQIRQVTVVLREQDHRLQAFLQRAYVGRMAIELVPLRQEGTIVQSLQAGLRSGPSLGPVRIVLGDTLITDPFTGSQDFVYVGKVADARRWCLAVTGQHGQIVDYLDKQDIAGGEFQALAGYYHLTQGAYLLECVERTASYGGRELSEVLRLYGGVHPIYARPVQEWYDFGHIDHLVDARRRLLKPRYFNSLTINPILNTITKVSEHDDKLADELDWYLNLPGELKVLAPRILSHERVDGHLQIVQEYYGYPTLAELYLYGDLHPDTWISILRHVLQIHQEFRRHPGNLESTHIENMYVTKTRQRLEALHAQDPDWRELLDRGEVIFNGQRLRGIWQLIEGIQKRAKELAHSAPVSVIHGDLCFSNILFDINHQIIRLIDPRGSFGAKGIYGDARYDLAKLRHSVHELYDYILADMFDLRATAAGFQSHIYTNGAPRVVGAVFDQMLADQGYNLDEIRFIEGLLFISMLPLHHGHLRRQQMMYLTGLSLLNEVL